MTQPTTKQYWFPDGFFDKIREHNLETENEMFKRMLREKDHSKAGLKGVITKLIRQLKNN